MGKFFVFAGLIVTLAINAQAVTKVACVGNSITEGYGLEWNDKKYPDHLQDILGSDYQVQNFGNSGKMFHKKSDESYWKQETFTKAYNFAPDIVIIELGTNDSKYFHDGKGSSTGYNYYNYEGKGYTRESLIQELQKDYEALIDTFTHQPQAPKIFATLQPYANNWDWFITDTVIVNQINPIIKATATAKGVELIDLHEQFSKPEWLLDDNVHPNATGAKELAQIIANGILKKSNQPESSESKSSSSAETESSSSINLVESSSSETETLTMVNVAKATVSTQGTRISIENFSGKISILDLNGNIINRIHSSGSVQIQAKHSGTYIIKIGNDTRKVSIK